MDKFVKDKIPEIQNYCQNFDVKELYLFGSACSDELKKDSDIDLLISFKDISIEKYTDNYFELHYLFQDLFDRKIDLITENSLSNPYFIDSINKSKILLYGE